jgi:hypothetical protein
MAWSYFWALKKVIALTDYHHKDIKSYFLLFFLSARSMSRHDGKDALAFLLELVMRRSWVRVLGSSREKQNDNFMNIFLILRTVTAFYRIN